MKISLKIICLFFLFTTCTEKSHTLIFSVGGAPNEVEFWEKIVDEFAKETKIKVAILRQPTDSDQRRQGLVVPFKAKKSDPDVFLMDIAWIAQFAASDWLEPLDTYLDKEKINLDVFFKKALDQADKYKGYLIALPVYIDGGILYYRKDLLDKYGYKHSPQTWKELLEFSTKIQKGERAKNKDFFGFVWQGAQYEGLICNFLEFAASNGGGIIINENDIYINSKENIEALKFMRDLIRTYKISPPNTFTEMKEEETRTFFQQGNALFQRNWPYAWGLHKKENSKIKGKINVSSLPHFQNKNSASTLGGWHIGLSKYSDDKSSSVRFMKFVTSHNIQKRLSLELGWNPARRDLYTDKELIKKMPHLQYLRDAFENAVARPNLPFYTLVSEILQKYISAVLADKITPSDALKSAEEDLRKIIKKYTVM